MPENNDQKDEKANDEAKDEQQEKPVEQSESEPEGKELGKEESREDEPNEEEEFDLERAKAKIAKANDEAKNLRTKLREAEDRLKNAKTPEEVDAITQKMTEDRETAEHSLLVENVALKHKLPPELAEVLQGSTREELEAHAKKLQKFVPNDDDDDPNLEGGLEPRSREQEASDPRSLAARHGARAHRR